METVEQNFVDDAQNLDAEQKNEQPADYYRSQQEVDRAFAKRLEAERQKWEREAAAAKPDADDREETGDGEAPDAGELSLNEQRRFLTEVIRAEEEIRKEDPYFDLGEELKRNPMFALMIANGYDAKRVYEFFYPIRHRGNLKKAVEREIMDRIRLRNTRPQTMGTANAAMSVRDISKLSDDEIRQIDARIKKGERVRL